MSADSAAKMPRPAHRPLLQAVLQASARRLARPVAGALAKQPAAEAFDDTCAGLMAEALGVGDGTAALWGMTLTALDAPTEDEIVRYLMACAAEA